MITINLFAELFDWDTKTTERAQRSYGVSRSLYTMARVGKAGASPLIFIDAAKAFIDALGAYADYRQAESKTRELEAEGSALAEMLKELEEQFLSQAQARNLKTNSHLRSTRESLVRDDRKLNIDVIQQKKISSEIKRLGEYIAGARLNSPLNCLPLLKLERTYYRLVDTQLELALKLVDE